MTVPALDITGLTRRFGDRVILHDLTLSARQGELWVLLGDSGSGKTTTLRLIAGLDTPDAGTIAIDGEIVAGNGRFVPPERRRVGMVFQDYALFPHLTAARNIAFALEGLMNGAERERRVREMLDRVGIAHLADRFPHQLSGGEQQRVALARALAPSPRLVLLDEPFSNLDARLRRALRDDLAAMLRAAGTTALFVTHDQEEALQMADRVAVMRAGRLLQAGSPRDLYLHPVDREVASFLGTAHFLPGTAYGDYAETAIGIVPLAQPISGAVEVLIRPEGLALIPTADGEGVVTGVRFYGHDQTVDVRLADGLRLTALTRPDAALEVGDRVTVRAAGASMAYQA
jgi:iron(III) transport system ATP-binding protein